MSAPMLAHLASASGAVTSIAINALWEDALLVACVWLLLRVWPGLNAATRYLVWSATLIATAIVPVATTLPFLVSSSPATATRDTAVRAPMPMVTHALTAAPVAASKAATHPSHAAQPPANATPARSQAAPLRLPDRFRMTWPLPLAIGVLAAWGLLALALLAKLAIGLARLEGLKRDALPLPVEYRDAMARWTAANKGSREVRLCVSDEIDVPVAVGLFDSMILIPRALLERLSEAEVDQISLHELAHLRRADDWSNGFQRLVLALFAWNPAVLFVGRQLDLEREVACDDWVLALTGLVRPYALCLTKMAETSSWPYRPMPAPGVFATRRHISLRIERLLGAGRNAATNLSLGPAAATIAIVAALAFAMQLVAPSVAASVETLAANGTATHEPVTQTARDTATQTAHSAAAHTEATKLVERSQTLVAKHETAVVAKRQTIVAAASPSPSAPATPTLPTPHLPALPRAIHVSATHVHVPAMHLDVPGVDVDVPAMTVPMPQLASAAAALHVAQASSTRNCSGCQMSGVDWSGRDMRNVSYTGVDLSKAKLQGTNFGGGVFNGVDFTGATLRNASFRGAHLVGCDFSHADLTGVDFTGATISGCQFTGAQLPSAQLRAVLNTCTGCDFSHANLSGLDLSGVRASGIDFTHANLANVNFSGAHFVGTDFTGADLHGVNLSGAELNGCDLSGV
ncbi:MAG TPA: pentapeptide repeat-containing protein, partial [Candidatus Tumulicola sp.]|nr:pentapeptide repeat-containing protein [Candidatus Tumulicola sp.]